MTSPAAAEVARYYAPPAAPPAGRSRRVAALLAVLGVHLLIAGLIAVAVVRPELAPPVRALAVRLLETPPPVAPKAEPPKPPPAKAAPHQPLTPPPVLAAAASAPAAPAFTVAPQPQPEAVAAPPTPAVAPAPTPAPAIVAARFDADYLQNPKPIYPPLSRRQGEEGKVVLRVRVSRDGQPLAVEVRQSSGFARLDDAAKNAVERWRFVPAKQGSEAIESSVLVPLHFTLSN